MNDVFKKHKGLLLYYDVIPSIDIDNFFTSLLSYMENVINIDLNEQLLPNQEFIDSVITNKKYFITILSCLDLESTVRDIINDNGLFLVKPMFNSKNETDETKRFSFKELSTGTLRILNLFFYITKYKNENVILFIKNLSVHYLVVITIHRILRDSDITAKSLILADDQLFTYLDSDDKESVFPITKFLEDFSK